MNSMFDHLHAFGLILLLLHTEKIHKLISC
jgi:hypothetical protein